MNLEILKKDQDDGKYSAMEPRNIDLSLVYGIGEFIADKVDFKLDIDLSALITSFGGRIHYVDYAEFRKYENLFENSIYVKKDGDFDILLPAYASPFENRFTLAHELGHYLLHKKDMSYACRSGNTIVEKEADCFALGFLMPGKNFKEAANKFEKCDLHIVFQVPEFAISARMRSLGILE